MILLFGPITNKHSVLQAGFLIIKPKFNSFFGPDNFISSRTDRWRKSHGPFTRVREAWLKMHQLNIMILSKLALRILSRNRSNYYRLSALLNERSVNASIDITQFLSLDEPKNYKSRIKYVNRISKWFYWFRKKNWFYLTFQHASFVQGNKFWKLKVSSELKNWRNWCIKYSPKQK